MHTTFTPAQEATITITLPLSKAQRVRHYLNEAGGNSRAEIGDVLTELSKVIQAAERPRPDF